VLYYRFFLHADKTERIPHLTVLKYRLLFLLTGALLSGVNAAIFWFCLMWFVAGTGLPQMWIGAHLVTLLIGFVLSFGISVVQAEHIPEVIYRACQLGSKALFLIPLSTGFRAIADSLLPSSPLTIGRFEMSSVDVFTFATALAMALYLLFAIMIWLAERRSEAGEGN
jgi:hypothetical protein